MEGDDVPSYWTGVPRCVCLCVLEQQMFYLSSWETASAQQLPRCWNVKTFLLLLLSVIKLRGKPSELLVKYQLSW